MGMYTGLRFTAKLSDKGQEAIKIMNEFMAASRSGYVVCWNAVRDLLDLPEEWMEDTRTTFIPYGGVTYMPDSWESAHHVDEEGRWHVCCSLKNYTGTIERFLKHVLPKMISEECVAESLYEEDHEPREHPVCPADV